MQSVEGRVVNNTTICKYSDFSCHASQLNISTPEPHISTRDEGLELGENVRQLCLEVQDLCEIGRGVNNAVPGEQACFALT